MIISGSFFERMLGLPIQTNQVCIEQEEQTVNRQYVDIELKSDEFLIGIKMKNRANDRKYQVKSYFKHLTKENDVMGYDKRFSFITSLLEVFSPEQGV